MKPATYIPVLLPTNEESNIQLHLETNTLHLMQNSVASPIGQYGWTNQHIIITSDEEIKEVFPQIVLEKLVNGTHELFQLDSIHEIDKENQKVIVATTNKLLPISWIDPSKHEWLLGWYNKQREMPKKEMPKEVKFEMEFDEHKAFNKASMVWNIKTSSEGEVCLLEPKLTQTINEYGIGISPHGHDDRILRNPEPKEINYKCNDCGAEMNEGEASVFTCCDKCWDKHYARPKEIKSAEEILDIERQQITFTERQRSITINAIEEHAEQREKLFRDFLRANHLTSKWEDYLNLNQFKH